MIEVEKPKPQDFLTKDKVFYVGSQKDKTVLIAVHPRLQEEGKLLSWWDTVKERVVEVKSMQVEDKSYLQIRDKRDNSYMFVPLSLKLYNNIVKARLFGKKEFATEEEMIIALEETMKHL